MKKSNLFLTVLIVLPFFSYTQGDTQRIDSLVARYLNQSDFTGSILVAKGDNILIKKGYGYSNSETKISNEPGTVYNIASLTKTFTAALILKLQEMKKLSVNDKLDKYYPGYPNGDHITIHQLLTHTSGIANYTDDKSFSTMDQTKEIGLDQMIASFKVKPLDFEPGTKFRYTNSGYTLLGYIIEKITGMSYGRALQQYIFTPLGMRHTSFGQPNQASKVATGYMMYYKNFTRPSFIIHPSISYATGAIYSTVEDLYKWNLALLNNKLLSKESIAAAYHKDKGPYGYGWFTDSLYSRQRVSHDGNIPGYKANINRMPEDKVCIIALSNSNNSSVGRMVRDIVNILYQKPLSRPFSDQPVIAMSDSIKKVFIGTYNFGQEDSSKMVVQMRGSDLTLKVGNQPAFDIYPVAKNQFKSGDIRVEFMFNNQGRPEQVFIYSNGEIIGGKKAEE